MAKKIERIGIIGYGNMGRAIAERAKDTYEIFVFDKDKAKMKDLSGIKAALDIADLLKRSEVVILAIKPQDFASFLDEIKVGVQDKMIISIAAGINTSYLENLLSQARVIRVMPNIPAKIGFGMSCLCKGRFATDSDLEFSEILFRHLGQTLVLGNEVMMDAATAISGSGPGYYFNAICTSPKDYQDNADVFLKSFIAALTEAAEDLGFANKEAQVLANATGVGAQMLLVKTNLSAAELREQVTSKGGTTEAALEVLGRGGSIKEAVYAALKRAKELSKS